VNFLECSCRQSLCENVSFLFFCVDLADVDLVRIPASPPIPSWNSVSSAHYVYLYNAQIHAAIPPTLAPRVECYALVKYMLHSVSHDHVCSSSPCVAANLDPRVCSEHPYTVNLHL
jgi:hypothetical protein